MGTWLFVLISLGPRNCAAWPNCNLSNTQFFKAGQLCQQWALSPQRFFICQRSCSTWKTSTLAISWRKNCHSLCYTKTKHSIIISSFEITSPSCQFFNMKGIWDCREFSTNRMFMQNYWLFLSKFVKLQETDNRTFHAKTGNCNKHQ